MKISFQWMGFIENKLICSIIQHHCDFLPVVSNPSKGDGSRFDHAKDPNKPNMVGMGWPPNAAEEWCYTYIYGSYASRNSRANGMPHWEIPDSKVADIVALFCIAGAEVRLIDDLLTIKC